MTTASLVPRPAPPLADARQARRHARLLLAGELLTDLTVRTSQVAMPLVVLAATGSVAATGVVGGAAGVPAVLAPWWTRRLRQWACDGRRLAVVAVLMAAAVGVLPVLAALGALSVPALAAAGLLMGAGHTVLVPGRTALLADVGDRIGPDRAVALVTWQDGQRRLTMIVGPGLGAAAVGAGLVHELLFLEAVAVLVAGLLTLDVRGEQPLPRGDGHAEAPSIRGELASRPDVLRGWIMRGTSCFVWFAFSLGMAIEGVRQGSPGELYAVGMTAYGVGALAATLIAVPVVRRVPPMVVATAGWGANGLAWVAMGLRPDGLGFAAGGLVAAIGVVLAITAISRIITTTSQGAARRTLVSGQSTVVEATYSAGLLAGGTVLAAIGVAPTFVAGGVLLLAVVLAAGPAWRWVRSGPGRR